MYPREAEHPASASAYTANSNTEFGNIGINNFVLLFVDAAYQEWTYIEGAGFSDIIISVEHPLKS